MIFIVVIGGIGTIEGPIVGTATQRWDVRFFPVQRRLRA
jgi:ABC-type branched-subunit amino acid transport system permease subunit